MYQYKNNNQLAFCIIIIISRIGQIILVIISAFVKKRKKGTYVIRWKSVVSLESSIFRI